MTLIAEKDEQIAQLLAEGLIYVTINIFILIPFE